MVSTRTLLAAGIAIIAVISLSAVVVVQQIALQRQSVTLSTAYTSTPTSTAPYVIVSYFGYTFTEFGNCKSSSGHVYLNVWIKMENHGYDRVPTASVVIGNSYPYYFYVGIGGQQFNGFPFSCQLSNEILPMTDVVNGLSVSGYLAFEVPANFVSYSLIYQPQIGYYNVQYFNEGFTTGTVPTVTTSWL